MRVLMLAPQPFFEPRGAPFCVYQHVQALVKQGYDVDLVTYPYGEDVVICLGCVSIARRRYLSCAM